MNKRKILIIGGLGFIGTNLIEELIQTHQYEIVVFEFPEVQIRQPDFKDKISMFYGDFTNSKDIEQVFFENQDISLVIHSISTTDPAKSNKNIFYDINSNLISTINLLNIMKKYSINQIVFFSSGGTIYGIPNESKLSESAPTDPICSYGIIKLAIEKYIYLYHKLHGLNYLIFRLSNPYGEYHQSTKQGLINVILMKQLMKKKIEIWGDGSVVRDYIYIKDLVLCIRKIIEQNIQNEIFNIGSGTGSSVNDIIQSVAEITGDVNVEYIQKRNFDIQRFVLDTQKLKSYININFTSLEEGILKTYNWLKTKKNK